MANGNQLPEGFVIDQPASGLPEGFVLDAPVEQPGISAAPDIPPVPGGQWMDENAQGASISGANIKGAPLPAENDYPMQNVIETAATVGTGAIAPMVAGAAGAADIINPFSNMEDTANMVESIQEAMTYVPRGSKSLETLQYLAEKMQPMTKAMETVENVSGDLGAEVSPAIGAISKAVPAAVMAATGAPNILRAIATAEKVAAGITSSPAVQLLKPTSKFKQKTLQKLKENAANPELASDIRLVSDDISRGKIQDNGTALVVLEDQVRKKAGNKAADQVAEIAKDVENGDAGAVARLEEIANEVAEPAPERSLVKYIEDGQGKLKTDPIAKEAVKQGFDEGTVAAIKGSSKADKSKMRKMLDIMKRFKENPLSKKRPSEIAGDSLLDRVKNIRIINRRAGQDLNRVARDLRGQEVDSSEAVGNFIDSLDEIGVSIGEDLKPRFKNSDVEFNAGAKSAIAGMVKRLSRGKPGVVPDAYELHRMKLLIDDMVTYGKSGEGIKGKTERILKKLRADIDASLDNNFPEYDAVNTEYADTINALNSLQDVAGRKMNLSGPNTDKALGILLRRLMSNAQSRTNLIDSVDLVESVNKKYGAIFDDDLSTLMLFADELDDVFGPVAKSSLAGETSKGVRSAARKASAGDSVGAATEGVGVIASKLKGINQKNQFKVLSDLLGR